MKGSTLRRSNLTKEKIAMLDALAKYNRDYSTTSNSDVSLDKQEELDVLWQNFKVASRAEKSPMAFFTTGVFVGVISTLVLAILISFVVGYSPLDDLNLNLIKAPSTESLKFTFIPADKQEPVVQQTASQNKEYTVQPGDSLEGIAIKFYGGFDQAKLKMIEEANNLANPNAIGIGQKLIIPMN